MGPSPGFRDLKWLKPVYAGDTCTYASEVVAARASNSRPGWGLLTVRNTGTNQHGEHGDFVREHHLSGMPAGVRR